MRAAAAVVAEAGARGTTCTTLRSAPPLTFRATPDGLFLVGTAAGPLGGDDLHLAVTVGAGATLVLRSVAASLVQPGPHPGERSALRIEVEVAPGGRLVWLPEATVAVRGCDHETTTVIRLGDGAELVWRDELVLGRHGEAAGSLLQRLRIDHPGGPLLRHDLGVGPRWPASGGPAVLDGAGAVGTLVTVGGAGPVGPDLMASGRDTRAVTVPLAAPGATLTTVVAATARGLRAALDAAAGGAPDGRRACLAR